MTAAGHVAFLGPDAFVFGEATTGGYVRTFRSAWETVLLLANDIEPTRVARGRRPTNRKALAQITCTGTTCDTKRLAVSG